MTLTVLGFNYRSAPLAVRERVAFHIEELPRALAALTENAAVIEVAILSTCNRSEIYFQGETQDVIDWLVQYRQVPLRELQACCYIHEGESALQHVFRVACGLDSMVLGEPQILGQLKEAEKIAHEVGTLGLGLNRLFQQSFALAKEVRSTTCIGREVVSMAAATVRLCSPNFSPIAAQNVLFIGAGEMIGMCLAYFAAQHPQKIVIANRTVDRGQKLAERYQAESIRLEEIPERLAEFDIVISCTASPLPIIGMGLVERAMRSRARRPVLLLDLAVPRDIEPEVRELAGVSLYRVDDLASLVESGHEARREAAREAEVIIAEYAANYVVWWNARKSIPLIRSLRDAAERLRRHELERALKRLARGEAPNSVIDGLSHRLMGKYLHAPMRVLNQAEDWPQKKDRNALSQWLCQLFAINKSE